MSASVYTASRTAHSLPGHFQYVYFINIQLSFLSHFEFVIESILPVRFFHLRIAGACPVWLTCEETIFLGFQIRAHLSPHYGEPYDAVCPNWTSELWPPCVPGLCIAFVSLLCLSSLINTLLFFNSVALHLLYHAMIQDPPMKPVFEHYITGCLHPICLSYLTTLSLIISVTQVQKTRAS